MSQGHPSLRPVQARLGDLHIGRLFLDPDPREALHLGCERRGAAAKEWIEDDAARRRDEAHEVAHEFGGLHGWMASNPR